MKHRVSEFLADRRGAVALILAIAAPALLLVFAGVVELAKVSGVRSDLQDVADATAIEGAQELALAAGGVQARAEAFARAQLPEEDTLEVLATIIDDSKLKVVLSAHRPSFFANLLPPGGFHISATATAANLNVEPLCVLAHGSGRDKIVNLLDTSQIDARDCLIHSNEDVVVEGSSWLQAGVVSAVSAASGRITPSAVLGAAEVPDPFADLPTGTNKPCSTVGKLVSLLTTTLPAGVHCGKVEVASGGRLTLAPGEHYFRGSELNVKENGLLYGRDVVIFLDKGSKVSFQDTAKVDLEGRETGPHAGFVLIADRKNSNDVEIWSDNVDNLLGTVYVPGSRLVVMGDERVAEDSDWTVVVAEEIQLKGAARLTINTGYGGSPVPVPEGVGPSGAGARLVR